LRASVGSTEARNGRLARVGVVGPKRANLLSIWVFGPAVGRPAETEKVYASGHTRIEVNPTGDERSEEPQSLGTINLRTNTREP
jgi:hypothetical protein